MLPPAHLKDTRLVVIGCAPVKFIPKFRAEVKLPEEYLLYCDPKRELYKALGMITVLKSPGGSSPHVKSSTMKGLLSSTWRGLKSMQMQGDVSQQGAQFVIGPGIDNLKFAHLDKDPMDHTDINILLKHAGLEPFDFV
eukprot:m.216908 g.216908  ORF g.216908 m.216908 type:complete len:138 (-) comp26237_c0_seq3:315-728(-)